MVFLGRVLRCAANLAGRIQKEPENIGVAWRKWYFAHSHYNRYGLYNDDMLIEDYHPEVKEAVRRLPGDLYDQRTFRIVRANQLEITKSYLPKEEWITYEDDVKNGHYLQPYIDEVLAEWKEKEDWERVVH